MTPTGHLARCPLPFWSYFKPPPKILKKIGKIQNTLLHYEPFKKIRVHPPGCPRKGGAPGNAIALLTAIRIGAICNNMGAGVYKTKIKF